MAKRGDLHRQVQAGVGVLGAGALDEELFVLRATDPLGPTLVEAWADLAVQMGVPVAKIHEARECAQAMRAWQREHGKKIPD